jgi:hypothetical protein
LTLLIQALTCKVSERDQLQQPSTYKALGSTHTFKKVYNVHWRLNLFLRNVQAANLVVDGNPDKVDKLVVHTIRELMEHERLNDPRELKAFMAKKDLEHQ